MGGQDVQQALQHHRVVHAERLRDVLVDRPLDCVGAQHLLGLQQPARLVLGRPIALCGEQLGEPADEHEQPAPAGQILVGALAVAQPGEAVGEGVTHLDRPILLDKRKELREEVGGEVLLGPPPDAALEPTLA